jgi:tetratricopeptide (TPR) repeat protein
MLIHSNILRLPTLLVTAIRKRSSTAGEYSQIAKQFGDTGIQYRQLGDWNLALEHYGQAIALYREVGDFKLCGHIQFNRGVVFSQRNAPGDSADARRAFEAAREHYRALAG